MHYYKCTTGGVVTDRVVHTTRSALPLCEVTGRLANTIVSKLDLDGMIMAGLVHTSLSVLQLKDIVTFRVVHYY